MITIKPGIYQVGAPGRTHYVIRPCVGGRRFPQERLPRGATVKQAEALLRRRKTEAEDGKLARPGRFTFDDLLQLVRGEHTRKHQTTPPLVHLIKYFAGRRAVEITRDRLKAYVTHRQGEGAADASIKNELSALKFGFRLAVEDGKLPLAPSFKGLLGKLQNARQGCFSIAELQTFVAALPAHLRAPVEFAAMVGWRKQNVLSLEWSQVDFARGEVRLLEGTTKTGEPVAFPFSALPRLAALLREQRATVSRYEAARKRIVPFVFPFRGNRIRDVRAAWRQAVKATGLKFQQFDPKRGTTRAVDPVFHDLRRTAATWLTDAGLDRQVIMQICGWKTEAMFERYKIVSDRARRTQVARAGKHYAAAIAAVAREPRVIDLKRQAAG